jgi:hypothetical protein
LRKTLTHIKDGVPTMMKVIYLLNTGINLQKSDKSPDKGSFSSLLTAVINIDMDGKSSTVIDLLTSVINPMIMVINLQLSIVVMRWYSLLPPYCLTSLIGIPPWKVFITLFLAETLQNCPNTFTFFLIMPMRNFILQRVDKTEVVFFNFNKQYYFKHPQTQGYLNYRSCV